MKRALTRRQVVLTVIAVAVVAVFAINLFFFLKKPHLIAVEPRIARSGDIVVLSGHYLGESGPRNELLVGDQRITASYILEWGDDRISFRLPEGMRSGDIRVIRPQGSSNPLLMTNQDTIPLLVPADEQQNYRLSLKENSDDSYWDVSLTGFSSGVVRNLSVYLNGRKLGPENIFYPEGGGMGIYVPVMSLIDGDIPDADGLESILEGQLSIVEESKAPRGDELSFLKSRRGSQILVDESTDPGDETVYANGPLFTLEVSIPDAALLAGSDEYQLIIPHPELEGMNYRLFSSLSGELSPLPANDYVHPGTSVIRYFPTETHQDRSAGSFTAEYYGSIPAPGDLSAVLQEASDNYGTELLFRQVFQAWLQPADDFLLDADQRSALKDSIHGSQGALPITRAMYAWFSNADLSENLRISALVDELRRLGIGARQRRGYYLSADESEFVATDWAEVFLPRWGWVPMYRESMDDGLAMGQAKYSYIAMPVGEEFPRLIGRDGGEVPLTVRLLFGETED